MVTACAHMINNVENVKGVIQGLWNTVCVLTVIKKFCTKLGISSLSGTIQRIGNKCEWNKFKASNSILYQNLVLDVQMNQWIFAFGFWEHMLN